MKWIFFILSVFPLVLSLSAQNPSLKKIKTTKEMCDILKAYNITDVLEDDLTFLKKQGFDPESVIEYAMNHPAEILECLFNINIDLTQNNLMFKVTGFHWTRQTYSGTIGDGWVNATLNNIRMLNASEAAATITLKNNKAIFMELTSTGGSGYSNTIENNILLYPQEERSFQGKLVFQPICDLKNTYTVNFDFNFSRGELTGSTFQEMVLRLALSVGAPLSLNPFGSYGLSIGFSNLAVYNSVLNIFWTAITGEWLRRDQIENSINALNLYDLFDLCPECKSIWEAAGINEFSPELISILHQKGIDPQTGLSLFFKTFIAMLKNPLTKDLAYEVAKKYLPSVLTEGGAAALATNLSVIVTGAWRVLALAPIAWDVWNTQKVEDLSGVEIIPVCVFSY